MAQEASLFSLRPEARTFVLDKWCQLTKELADSSMVSAKRLDEAGERMERSATTPAQIIAARHLRRQYRHACP